MRDEIKAVLEAYYLKRMIEGVQDRGKSTEQAVQAVCDILKSNKKD